jgi:hypothetical protein
MAERILQQWVPDAGGLMYRLAEDREHSCLYVVLLDERGGEQQRLTLPYSFAPVLAEALGRIEVGS